jgi:hypothetical protein
MMLTPDFSMLGRGLALAGGAALIAWLFAFAAIKAIRWIKAGSGHRPH